MFRTRSALLVLLALSIGTAVALGRGSPDPAPPPGAEDKVTVELPFATEHVPAGLKAGAKVVLHRVDGRSTTPAGEASLTTVVLVPKCEVASVTPVDKPATPEQAVKVGLRVTKAQAAVVERHKARRVSSREMAADGSVKEEQRPVTFRLEPAK
jgi:hypothetical protein